MNNILATLLSGEHYFWVFWGVKFSHKFTILKWLYLHSFLSFTHSFSHSPTHPRKSGPGLTVAISKAIVDYLDHGPACIAFHCSPPFSLSLGVWGHFAKTWVSLQTTTCKGESTKYFDILLLLTSEKVLHAPSVQNLSSKFHRLTPKQPSNSLPFLRYKKSLLWPIRNGGMADY